MEIAYAIVIIAGLTALLFGIGTFGDHMNDRS